MGAAVGSPPGAAWVVLLVAMPAQAAALRPDGYTDVLAGGASLLANQTSQTCPNLVCAGRNTAAVAAAARRQVAAVHGGTKAGV